MAENLLPGGRDGERRPNLSQGKPAWVKGKEGIGKAKQGDNNGPGSEGVLAKDVHEWNVRRRDGDVLLLFSSDSK